jgi:DNA-binding response OmpR family regulator
MDSQPNVFNTSESNLDKGMKKVLLVDDDLLSVEFMRMYLESKGYQSLTAHSVESARLVVEEHRPNVVVTDLQLSDGTGIDVANHAKSICSPMVIGVTGYDRQSLEAKGLALSDLSSILLKPLDLKQLDDALAIHSIDTQVN